MLKEKSKLVLIVLVVVEPRLMEVSLGARVLGKVFLEKHTIILELVMKMVAEEAAGMAALLAMIMTVTMMAVVAVAAQDMYTPQRLCRIILVDVY